MTTRPRNAAPYAYRTIRRLLVCIVLVHSCGAVAQRVDKLEVEQLTEFLQKDRPAPIDYVLRLFDKYDMVILCERIHSEATQWDLFFDLISDRRFVERVGTVFTEYGVVNLQPYVDAFMANDDLPAAETERRVVHIMRNLSSWAFWSNTNFYDFLKKLYALNQNLAENERISLYFSDIPFSWEGMTPEKYDDVRQKVFPKRDEIMANRIERQFRNILNSDDNRKKCLVILNYRHAFGPIRDPNGALLGNTAEHLFQAFPGAVANVLINTATFDEAGNFVRIQNGTWDAAFNQVANPDIGFDFGGSPFGDASFDLFPFVPWVEDTYQYQNVFTGFIFYKPLSEHIIRQGMPGLFDDFDETALERARCIGEDYYRRVRSIIRSAQRRENPIRESAPPYALNAQGAIHEEHD